MSAKTAFRANGHSYSDSIILLYYAPFWQKRQPLYGKIKGFFPFSVRFIFF